MRLHASLLKTSLSAVQEISPKIAKLGETARSLGVMMGEQSVRVVHVKGLNHVLSCYQIQHHWLVLWMESHGSTEMFETSEAEALVAPHLENLGHVFSIYKL